MMRGTAVLLISAQQLLLVCNALPRATWTGTEMQHLSLGSGSRSMLAAEPAGAGGHPSLGGTNASELASSTFDYLSSPPADSPITHHRYQSKQFACRSGSIQASCPALYAKSAQPGLDEQLAQLAVPADARWFFEGPSYLYEIFVTLVAAPLLLTTCCRVSDFPSSFVLPILRDWTSPDPDSPSSDSSNTRRLFTAPLPEMRERDMRSACMV